jgi:hypothetical protein
MSTIHALAMTFADAPHRVLACAFTGLNNRNGNNNRLSGRAVA